MIGFFLLPIYIAFLDFPPNFPVWCSFFSVILEGSLFHLLRKVIEKLLNYLIHIFPLLMIRPKEGETGLLVKLGFGTNPMNCTGF